MTKFIFTTDHHFSHKPPGRRQGDYFTDLSLKMQQVIDYCNVNHAIPLFGGDLFHLKDPSKIPTFNLLSFLGDMSKLLSGFNTKPLCAIGNHDIRFDRLSTLPEQPLGLLSASGVIKTLCNYDLLNLMEWVGPSGHIHLVPKILPGEVIYASDFSRVLVCSTPYMDDPQDLLAYLGSEQFHTSLGDFARLSLPPVTALNYSVSCILLLHTLSGTAEGEFFGLQRASYPAIHSALAYSALGRATSAVLFGHEHTEMGEYVLPIDHSPLVLNNLPPGYYIATMGTIYVNPGAFARSTLDYIETEEEPRRSVNMMELEYTQNGAGLSVSVIKIPLEVRPLAQLFGVSNVSDPLNQVEEVVSSAVVTESPVMTWNSFNEALNQLNQVAEDPSDYLSQRLESEPPEVIVTVKSLLGIP